MKTEIELLIHKSGPVYIRFKFYSRDGRKYINHHSFEVRDFKEIWDNYHFTLTQVSEAYGQYYIKLKPLYYTAKDA